MTDEDIDKVLLSGGTALMIDPGDSVLITFAGRFSMQQLDCVKVHLERAFPGVTFALIDGVVAIASYRPVG